MRSSIDGIPELAYSFGSFWIFGCINHRYEVLFELPMNGRQSWMGIDKLTDANQNGMPELLVRNFFDTQGDTCYTLYEWNGFSFLPILVPEGHSPDAENIEGIAFCSRPDAYFDLEDIDIDGVEEYVLHDTIPTGGAEYGYGPPWRNQTSFYKWNGKRFIFYRKYFSPPEFRFQAIQDADMVSLYGEYDKAQELYKQAIFDENLRWWTRDRGQYELEAWSSKHYQFPPMPTLSSPDPQERDYLEAYARFRIMALYVVRGWMSDAQIVYDTLQKKYASSAAGQVYAKMAQDFWSEYSTSQNVGLACGAAIHIAQLHGEEATKYIGSKIHGFQGMDYSTSDLCPFK